MAEVLREDDVARFHRDGYLVVEQLVSSRRVQELRDAFDALVDIWSRDCGVSPRAYLDVVCQWTGLWERDEVFFSQLHHPRMVAIARQLIGAEQVQLFHDHLIYKPPRELDTPGDGSRLRSGTIPWHQDFAFWPVDEPRALSCWLALDDVVAESGAMAFMPGAHRDGEEPPVDFLCRQKSWGERESQARTVEVPLGGAVFHSCLSWHTSPPNQSERPRRAYIAIMLDARCRWRPEHADWHPMNKRVSVAPGERLNRDAFPILGDESRPFASFARPSNHRAMQSLQQKRSSRARNSILAGELSVFSAGEDIQLLLTLLQRTALGGDRDGPSRSSLQDLSFEFCNDTSYRALMRLARTIGLDCARVPDRATMQSLFADVELSNRALRLHGGRDVYSAAKLRLWQELCVPFLPALGPDSSTLHLLRQLIALDTSPGAPDESIEACVAILATALQGGGFQVELVRGQLASGRARPIIIARRPARDMDGRLVLYGHYDVDEVRIDAWDTEPFTVTEKNARLYGLGIGDNKAALALRIVELSRAERSPELLWFIQGGEELGSRFAHQVLPGRMAGRHATLWLDENGYHDNNGTQRILARQVDDPRSPVTDQAHTCDRTGAFVVLVERLASVAGEYQLDHRVEARSLNKDFFEQGCPWNRNLPKGARYLSVGTNDPRSGIHRANESVPMWTFPVHKAQLAAILEWVDETARRSL